MTILTITADCARYYNVHVELRKSSQTLTINPRLCYINYLIWLKVASRTSLSLVVRPYASHMTLKAWTLFETATDLFESIVSTASFLPDAS